VLAEVGLGEESDKPFRLYSAGMKQKLLLARALLGRPVILLLDEPTTHLDPAARKAVHNLIRERLVAELKTTVLLCTHDLAEAEELADHLILLDKGKALAEGALPTLRAQVQPHVTLALTFAQAPRAGWTGDLPIDIMTEQAATVEMRLDTESAIPDVVNAAVSHGGRVLRCCTHEESLPDMFARMTKGNSA
jgi:ABC-2 type transport system ATP-binding protein